MASIFDVIGPIMIGPSSSHTAGAVRLGRMASCIFQGTPETIEMVLYGSFAKTYRGHGTDKALLAGLLGLAEDDERIRSAKALAKEKGLVYTFVESDKDMGHPNVVTFHMSKAGERPISVTGRSLGGGRILITDMDGQNVAISGDEFTMVIPHQDQPGMISKVTGLLGAGHINVSNMQVFRKVKNELAVMVIETDTSVDETLVDLIRHVAGVVDVMTFPKL